MVQRSAGSHGIDLIALKHGDIMLISCKYHGYLRRKEKESMLMLARRAGGKAFYTARDKKGKWRLTEIDEYAEEASPHT